MDKYGDLYVFHRTADAGSFSAAARLLNLSPSTISKLVARLEDRLGARLFNRTSRSLSLTAEGVTFYERAEAVINAMELAESSLRSAANAPQGTLRIYCHPTFATYQLAHLMPEFCERFPEVRIEWVLGNEQIDPAAENIDVVIRSGALEDSSLIARKVTWSRWVICATPGYLERNGRPQRPDDLLQANCLNFTVKEDWRKWPLEEDGTVRRLEVSGNMASNYGEMIRELVLNGIGIGRLAEFHIARDVKAGRLEILLPEFHAGEVEAIYAIYQRRRHLTPRIRCFIDFLHEKLVDAPWQLDRKASPEPV